jgi:hypothetical protein
MENKKSREIETFSLSLEECFDTFVIRVENPNNEEKIIIDIKKQWIKHFTPLLHYYIENFGIDDKITSEDLTNLYIFYMEGVRIKKTFSVLDLKTIKYLSTFKNPLKDLNEDIPEMVEMGTYLHQVKNYYETVKYKMNIFSERYDKVFCFTNDPIDWFIRNNNSFKLYCNPINVDLKEFWRKINLTENQKLDPVLQQ